MFTELADLLGVDNKSDSYSALYLVADLFAKPVLGAFSFFVTVLISLSKKLTFENNSTKTIFLRNKESFQREHPVFFEI